MTANNDRETSTGRRRRVSTRQVLHPETPPWIFRAIVLALVAFWVSRAAVSIIGELRIILLTVAVSFIASCAIENPVARLNRLGVRRGLAAGIVLGLLVLAVLGLAGAVGALVLGQVVHLVKHSDQTITQRST